MPNDLQGEKTPPIYIVSGGKGLAGDAVVKSVLIQFPNNKVPVIIEPDVLNQKKVDEVISKVLATNGIVVHTMVDPEMRKMLIEECTRNNVKHIDLAGNLSDYLSDLLNIQPISKPGLYRLSNIAYFQRVEAIDFTLKLDDGQNVEKITQADIVLTGVSRTGKTPLSVYLAMFGWKVANVPIVNGIDPPSSLFEADPKRVFGLNISPVYLITQRANRIKNLHMGEDSDYIDKRKVADELAYAERIFRRSGFTEIMITNKPIESSANEILTILTDRFNQNDWKKNPPVSDNW
jgi:[pyruvate, water dikinase]-phosphate phosphotransferase / [pyruvate, water dikinase] kinase